MATSASPPTHETSPLLLQKHDPCVSSWINECSWMLRKSIPVTGTYLLNVTIRMATVYTMGHLGSEELAGAALGNTVAAMTAYSTVYGMLSSLDTLCSQAWAGAKDKTLVGIYLQRAIIIIGIMYVGIFTLWLNAYKVLRFFGQREEMAEYAATYLRYLMLGAPAYSLFEALRKYQQAQGIMHAATTVVFIMSPVNFALIQFLVSGKPFNLGFIGAPIGTSITFWLMFLLLLGYSRFIEGREAWGGWNRACLRDWGKMIRLAVPGIINLSIEWWTTELMVLFASYLDTIQVSAQSIMISVFGLSCTPAWGMSLAAANRIGNYLGQGYAAKAKQNIIIVCVLAFAYGTTAAVLFSLIKSAYVPIFSGDAAVAETVAGVVPIFAATTLFMSSNNVSTGILRGLGRPDVTSMIELISFYLVGFPLGYYVYALLYPEAAAQGPSLCRLWSGLFAAMILAAASHLAFIYRTDWCAEANKAQASIKASEAKIVESIVIK